MSTKPITIESLGSGTEHEVDLSPTTTVGEALKSIGLDADNACLELDDPQRLLAEPELLFPLVESGAKLHASPLMKVGQ